MGEVSKTLFRHFTGVNVFTKVDQAKITERCKAAVKQAQFLSLTARYPDHITYRATIRRLLYENLLHLIANNYQA